MPEKKKWDLWNGRPGQSDTGKDAESTLNNGVRIRVLRSHTDYVKSCQFCDNDTKILSASYDKNIILWDVESGENIQTYLGHTDNVSQARANKDVTRIVSSGWDKKLHVWDAETGEILWTGDHNGIVTCCNISMDGQLIVTASDLDYKLKIWDINTGEVVQEVPKLHKSTITSCQFSPKDDRIISTSMDHTTLFFDRTSEKPTLTLKGHINVISNACVTHDDRKSATVSWDKSIALWDISTGMFRSQGPDVIEKAHEGSISSCDFSPDGSLLVTGGYDQTVALWDTENMVQKLRLQGHADWVEDVCYSQDMKWLLSCSRDKTVRLWNVEESDKIPVVLENRKSIGLRMYKCSTCGKAFSLNQSDNSRDSTQCVFCRLQTPDRNQPYIDL